MSSGKKIYPPYPPRKVVNNSGFFKDKIFAPLVVAIGLAVLGALVKIIFLFSAVPGRLDNNDREHAAMKVEVQGVRTSLQRQISELRAEIFYLQNGRAIPLPQQEDK